MEYLSPVGSCVRIAFGSLVGLLTINRQQIKVSQRFQHEASGGLKAFRIPDDSRGMTVHTAQISATGKSSTKSSSQSGSGLRRWSRPGALAVLAITAGSLGLSTSAFATTSASATSAGTRAVTSTGTTPEIAVGSYLESYAIPAATVEPVIVFASDADQNVVELTPSGALVVLVRIIRIEPVVRKSVPVEKSKVVSLPIVSSVTTTKTYKIDKPRRPRVFFVGWWAGDPNASWHAFGHFCDGQKGGWQPQSDSFQSSYGRHGRRNH